MHDQERYLTNEELQRLHRLRHQLERLRKIERRAFPCCGYNRAFELRVEWQILIGNLLLRGVRRREAGETPRPVPPWTTAATKHAQSQESE